MNLSTLEGAMSNLVFWHLLHLSADLIMIPPQLSSQVDWDEEDENRI